MTNDAQMQALAKAVAEQLRPTIAAMVDEQVQPLVQHNRTLLSEKKTAESKRTHDRRGIPFDAGYRQEDEDRHLAVMRQLEESAQKPIAPTSSTLKGQQAEFITREAARDAAAYRKAQQAAETRGVPLRVIDDESSGADLATGFDLRANPQNTSTPGRLRQFEDAVHKVRYIRRDQVGQSPVKHRLQAERDGFKLAIYSAVEDLDDDGRTAYAEAGGENV